jgi:hypothetical protein
MSHEHHCFRRGFSTPPKFVAVQHDSIPVYVHSISINTADTDRIICTFATRIAKRSLNQSFRADKGDSKKERATDADLSAHRKTIRFLSTPQQMIFPAEQRNKKKHGKRRTRENKGLEDQNGNDRR